MAILPILHYPDERLYTVASPVRRVDDSVRRLIDDMAETMYVAPGIGLAATQVNVHKQVIVIDISEARNELLVLVNPRISSRFGSAEREEGCLSVPGVYEKVTRAERVNVQALDRSGERFDLDAEGLLAVCVQHEIDHLKGKVFVEYLSRLKQMRIRQKLKKIMRVTM
ncbi:MAG: peptide deformylase [Burkholderiales bacterium]